MDLDDRAARTELTDRIRHAEHSSFVRHAPIIPLRVSTGSKSEADRSSAA